MKDKSSRRWQRGSKGILVALIMVTLMVLMWTQMGSAQVIYPPGGRVIGPGGLIIIGEGNVSFWDYTVDGVNKSAIMQDILIKGPTEDVGTVLKNSTIIPSTAGGYIDTSGQGLVSAEYYVINTTSGATYTVTFANPSFTLEIKKTGTEDKVSSCVKGESIDFCLSTNLEAIGPGITIIYVVEDPEGMQKKIEVSLDANGSNRYTFNGTDILGTYTVYAKTNKSMCNGLEVASSEINFDVIAESMKTWYVPDDYPTIHAAVNNATAGDTIIVRDSTYTENVDVDKRLTIKSENGSASTIVQAANPNDHVFGVTADYVNISGFTVTGVMTNDSYAYPAGIYLYYASHCNISGNNISNDVYQVYTFGISLKFSSGNILNNNSCSNYWHGIDFASSCNNTISNNTISNNYAGIELHVSSNNTFSNNTISENMDGIELLWYSSDNTLRNNNVLNNHRIDLEYYSSNNNFYLNNFINISIVNSYNSTNTWNSTERITYTYNDTVCINYLGNYWDDYNGSDANDDGIGDTPYSVDGDKDNYPLIEPFENYKYQRVQVCVTTKYWESGNYQLRLVANANPGEVLSINISGPSYLDSATVNKPGDPKSTDNPKQLYDDGQHWDSEANDGEWTVILNIGTQPKVGDIIIFNITYKDSTTEEKEKAINRVFNETAKLISPPDGSIVNSTTPTFEWECLPISGLTYSVQIDDVNHNRIYSVYDLPDGTTSHTIPSSYLVTSVTYYWLVSATDDNGNEALTNWRSFTVRETNVFDTRKPINPYPSIFGTHNGTITPNQTIIVSKLYTYPCSGTGGHTEYARIWNLTWNATATWNGYQGDWHNISFDKTFTLVANETYNYTIRTGSYPQIHHNKTLLVPDGEITCSEFIDANGKVYNDWIPAIRLWGD